MFDCIIYKDVRSESDGKENVFDVFKKKLKKRLNLNFVSYSGYLICKYGSVIP